MHLALIGTGRIGRYHAALLTSTPGVTAITVADVDQPRAAAVAADLGIEAAASVTAAITAADAVVIAAATDAHADLIMESTAAGKPTFCEKPIALDLASTRTVVDHVTATGATVHMGFQRRFDPGYRAARQLVATGELGTIYVIRMVGHDPQPPHEAYIPVSGGLFRDFGVHDFDAIRYVTGDEVVEVYADGAVLGFPVFATYGDIDTGVAILTLGSGARALLSSTRHNPHGYDIRMELFGSGDSAVVGWDERTPLRSLEPGGPQLPADPYPDFQARFRTAYQRELAAFVEVAAGDRPSPCTVVDALEALRIAVACDRSRAEHRPVRLEEVA
ncbi:MAG: Gfo/Idh/MocA family oxidoreductase [Acidimicrobiia bacterium]|nr:Gfo/Idh/MocA family oxidoreductase [Acidimicrobiia bacterium]